MAHSRVTLKDVARLAGVSINTVSRALNNKPDVNPKTRAQVLAAARKLEYVPNPLAQGLRGKHTRSIGVIVADIANPFFAEVIQGVEEVAFRKRFAITVGNSGENGEKESYLVRTLMEQRVAGILITPAQRDHNFYDILTQRHLPFVLIARRFEMLAANAVLNDDYVGSYQAVDYLVKSGRRRILFLNGPSHLWSAAQRLQGYKKALEDLGLKPLDEMVFSCEPTMHSAYEAMLSIISQGIEMDAVMTFSDYMALGAMKALRDRGVRIPDDVAVMGYDGIDIGEMVQPSLSTVAIEKRQLGIEATNILLGMIEEDGPTSAKQIILPPKIVIRDST